MNNFKKKYRELEMNVLANLRYAISTSKEFSKHLPVKCIKVNVFDYTEIANINNQLTFLDSKGNHHSLFSECNLEDLIDILHKAELVD